MPVAKQGVELGRHIIQPAQASRLAGLIHRIKQSASMALLDVIGPPGQAHAIVTMMTRDQARRMEQQPSPISIEPGQAAPPFSPGNTT